MVEKITFSPLEIHAQRIRDLVESKKYRNSDDFFKSAIEILLTWESEHPEEVMELMKSLMPFSPQQEAFMKQSMNPEELKKQFGDLEIDKDFSEISQQKELARTDDDHLKLRDNYKPAKKYIESLKITKPKSTIPYDGYPLLSGFYSRILPVKIVLTVLCHLLERNKETKIELQTLRIYAYDIAEEISESLTKYENEKNILRNKKMSTGLPKKGREEKDEEKITMAQKRFKDQFVGKVRKNRITKKDHFEGALSALGLVNAFEENEKIFVSLTQYGKDLFLIDNPVIEGDYDKGSFSKEESEFIYKKLIPQRELEKEFIDIALKVIKDFPNGEYEKFEKITNALDNEFRQATIDYLEQNPKAPELYNLNHLEPKIETAERKIIQWRLATMGRLAELGVVNWLINEKGYSEYSIN